MLIPRPIASLLASSLASLLASLLPLAVLLFATAARAQSPAEELRRKSAAAAALKKGIELRGEACQQLAKSLSLDASKRLVLLRVADCKRLAGELARAESLVARSVALATSRKPPRPVDEPRAAALARLADEQWALACAQFAQSLRGDVTLEAAQQVVTCQLARGELVEARALLAAVLPTLASQPPPVFRRLQPMINALSAEVDRQQPYLTIVEPPGAAGGGSTLTVDGIPAASGQVLPLDPGSHTVIARSSARTNTFTVSLQPSEKRVLGLAQELEKQASAEFSAGAELLGQACHEIERVANSPLSGAPAIERLASCKRLTGDHTTANALWTTGEAMTAGAGAAPHRAEAAATLHVADENLRQACAHFQASLELDRDLATELAVASCQLREGKLRPAKQRLEQALQPPSPLAAPRDQLGRNQAELARMLLSDVERMQPKIRVEPAPGFQGTITLNRLVIEPNTTIAVDPGHYFVLQIPTRGPRVVHEVVIGERERVVLKHNLRCNALGKSCVDPEKAAKAQQLQKGPVPSSSGGERAP